MLALWHRLLAPGGTLIVGDVIPPDAGALTDVKALLGYAAANGFFLAALWGLARTAVSPYSRLRSRLGVTRYTQSDFMQKLKVGGLWRRTPAAQPGAQCRPHDLPGPPALNPRFRREPLGRHAGAAAAANPISTLGG